MAGNGRGKAHRASSPRGRSLLCAPGAWRGDPVQGDGNRSRRAEHGGHPGSPGHGARRPGRAARRRRLEGGGAEPSECWLTHGSRAPAPGNTNLFALTPRPRRSQTRRKRTVRADSRPFPAFPAFRGPDPQGEQEWSAQDGARDTGRGRPTSAEARCSLRGHTRRRPSVLAPEPRSGAA